MLSVGATESTESAAILDQSPGFRVQFDKFHSVLMHLLGRGSAAGMTFWSLIEYIRMK